MELTVYNKQGKAQEAVNLPTALFGQPLRPDLLHRVVEAARHNSRQPVAHTKDRRDRRGGGTKPWRQKGTGRARHGSIRSPLWRKGGVTFGPRNDKKLKKQVNQKEKQAALASALSAKYEDGELLLVDELSPDEPSASTARSILDQLGEIDGFGELKTRRNNAALIVVPELDQNTKLSFQNFGNIGMQTAEDVNALDLLTYKFTVIVSPEATFSVVEDRVN